ncbi:hypothetical protein GLYMA_02G188600v4 [Glycine max]|uniref:APO domain-containing protein n=1 Tax=Glycine max TaxID=3847 RepID=A0A0R0L486_SOYBN|nr:hypothetical protein GYH30_004500 [Glycine max]KRH72057.1 hypothetical protein GLYMA_02G188600v4 [Glycine max]
MSTCNELPRKLNKSERKPPVTSFNDLKRQARLKKKERQKVHENTLQPPENGLLVDHLIPIAHEVYAARCELISSVSTLVNYTAIYTCSLCGEVHVGHAPHKIRTCDVRGSPSSKEHSWAKVGVEHVLPLVDSFHLYDRIGRAVSHNEMLEVDRIPAIVELIIDFEKRFPKEISLGEDIEAHGFWLMDVNTNSMAMQSDDIQATAVRGMKAWEKMRGGASKLMGKYAVQTCGYYPEVQVGPKGHRGATIDDLAPPVYVYHIRDDQHRKPLVNELKRYYGMLPAVVELFAQAGAPVDKNYASMMREDVVIPEMDEEKLVV